MLLDIQGSFFKLYNPEIATTDLVKDVSLDSKEVNFCPGTFPVLQLMNSNQSTFVTSTVT